MSTEDLLAGIGARGQVAACGEGWWSLIDRLDKALAAIDPDYQLGQVEQKYGTLRYRANTDVREPTLRQAFGQLIEGAAQMSAQICEVCGQRGRLYQTPPPSGWLKTLCADCAVNQSQPTRPYRPSTEED